MGISQRTVRRMPVNHDKSNTSTHRYFCVFPHRESYFDVVRYIQVDIMEQYILHLLSVRKFFQGALDAYDNVDASISQSFSIAEQVIKEIDRKLSAVLG